MTWRGREFHERRKGFVQMKLKIHGVTFENRAIKLILGMA
jgi:hypothetical protein